MSESSEARSQVELKPQRVKILVLILELWEHVADCPSLPDISQLKLLAFGVTHFFNSCGHVESFKESVLK